MLIGYCAIPTIGITFCNIQNLFMESFNNNHLDDDVNSIFLQHLFFVTFHLTVNLKNRC